MARGKPKKKKNQSPTPGRGGAPAGKLVRVRFGRQCRNALGVVFARDQRVETFVGSRVLEGVPDGAYEIEDRAVHRAPRTRALS